jgi:Leucine-rich repeat (LRR) protein
MNIVTLNSEDNELFEKWFQYYKTHPNMDNIDLELDSDMFTLLLDSPLNGDDDEKRREALRWLFAKIPTEDIYYMVIRDTVLSDIPPEINRFTSLTNLDITNSFPFAWKLERSQATMVLDPSRNTYDIFPKQLETVFLSLPTVSDMSPCQHFPSLKHLTVQGHPDIHPSIYLLSSLESLEWSNSSLETVEPEIWNFPNLKILVLDNNELTELPPIPGPNHSLEKLMINNNIIHSLDKSLVHLKALTFLNANKNNIQSLPPELWEWFAASPALQIKFEQNPVYESDFDRFLALPNRNVTVRKKKQTEPSPLSSLSMNLSPHTTGFSFSELQDMNVREFLQENPKHMAILYADRWFLINREDIEVNYENNIVYACNKITSDIFVPANINTDPQEVLFRVNNLVGSVTTYTLFSQYLSLLQSKDSLFVLQERLDPTTSQPQTVVSVVSKYIIDRRSGYQMSESHCQEGQGGKIVDIVKIEPVWQEGGQTRKNHKNKNNKNKNKNKTKNNKNPKNKTKNNKKTKTKKRN